jgi:hypothetical protein
MPLEDLAALGYKVYRPTEDGVLPEMASVWGFGQQWNLAPGQDEAELVTQATNFKTLYDKMTQAMSYFSDNYTNWATMTAGQKDGANRQAQRALANLIRLQRGDLTSGGA